MKVQLNKTTILLALAIALAGFGIGWLIFDVAGGTPEVHAHDHDGMEADIGGDMIWTCSMHPQIRQPEPGDCPICGMDLIPLKTEGETAGPNVIEMTETAMKLANIRTVEVTLGKPVKELRLDGRLCVDEELQEVQTAHFPGRVERLYVEETGETVRQGEPLLTIYSPELVQAQEELLQAARLQGQNRELLLQAARSKLKRWKLSEAQIDEIIETGEVQTELTIRADRGGVVMERLVSEGDYVQTGEVLFRIASLNELWASFDAYESQLPWLREGDRVKFTVSSLPGREFEAPITFIDPVVDPNTRAAQVRAEVNNRQGMLKPNMFITGYVESSAALPEESTLVPKSAVLWTGERSLVYVRLPEYEVPTFMPRKVTLGQPVGDLYVVEEGLEPGERVVTNGTFTVDAAAQLAGGRSMMNEPVAIVTEEAEKKLFTGIPEFEEDVPEDFQEQLSSTLQVYLELKEALVASDAEAAQKQAARVLAALEEVDMRLLETDAQHRYWMQKADDLVTHLKKLRSRQELEEQRESFRFISNLLVETAKAFGTGEGDLYLQFCPMANENKGAYWLSGQEIIRNPYYGEAMLSCGEVREEL